MAFLALTVLFQTAFSLVTRSAQRHGRNVVAIGAIFHLTATGAFVVLWAIGGWTSPARTTALLGMGGGVCFAGVFLSLMTFMASRGVALASRVSRLGVMVPAVVAIIAWGERPSVPQAGGTVLAVAALWLMSLSRTALDEAVLGRRIAILAVAIFLISGGAMLSLKGFQMTDLPTERDAFFLILFGAGSAVTCTAWALRSRAVGRGEWLSGIALGLITGSNNRFLLLALEELPASVVFPMATPLVLVFTTLFASFVWREPLGRLGTIGMSLAVIATVLIGLGS